MATTFLARYLPGIGVVQLVWGEPTSASGRHLEREGQILYTFNPQSCFGSLWYWREGSGRPHRVLAIVRALENPLEGVVLPGIFPAVEVRVLVEQSGPLGNPGPVDDLLDSFRWGEGCLHARSPALPVAAYLRLRAKRALRPTTLRRLRDIFDGPRSINTRHRPNPRGHAWGHEQCERDGMREGDRTNGNSISMRS